MTAVRRQGLDGGRGRGGLCDTEATSADVGKEVHHPLTSARRNTLSVSEMAWVIYALTVPFNTSSMAKVFNPVCCHCLDEDVCMKASPVDAGWVEVCRLYNGPDFKPKNIRHGDPVLSHIASWSYEGQRGVDQIKSQVTALRTAYTALLARSARVGKTRSTPFTISVTEILCVFMFFTLLGTCLCYSRRYQGNYRKVLE